MTPQHPAAPETETDASGLDQLDKVLLYLWSTTGSRRGANGRQSQLDYGKRQARMAVERILAERLRVVEGERDAEVASGADLARALQATIARAESAEAAHARTIAGLRAWCAANEIAEPPLDWAGLGEFLDRALLAGGGA